MGNAMESGNLESYQAIQSCVANQQHHIDCMHINVQLQCILEFK